MSEAPGAPLARRCVAALFVELGGAHQSVGREVRVEVTDRGSGTPAMRSPGPDDPTGRGLLIVNMLAKSWGVEHRAAAGNSVWFTLAAPPAEPSPSRASSSTQAGLRVTQPVVRCAPSRSR